MSTQFRRVGERERLEAVRLHSPAEVGGIRACAWPGCAEEGCYRAPRSRHHLRDFQWLCLEHVREFNRSWDYFAGMSAPEIEAHQRADVTWHRPSWRFGIHGSAGYVFVDPLGLFAEQAGRANERPALRPTTKAEAMMDVLDLESGFTLVELKSRYKTLVKRHHPDLHGGDKASEERLKLINEAYTYLKDRCLPG